MEHAFFADRLSAYFDNELPPQEKQVVDEHLRDCAECRDELARLARLADAVNRYANLADTDYWERSAQKIEQRLGFVQKTVVTPIPRTKLGSGLAWKAVAAAASISVLAYIGINSEKILKRENLEPQRIQTPSTITNEQSSAGQMDSTFEDENKHELSTPPRENSKMAPATDDKKQSEPKLDHAVEPTKGVPPAIQKSRAIPPTEQIQTHPDVSLAERPTQESNSNQTALESQNVTVTIPEERGIASPTSLAQQTSTSADSALPQADEFAGRIESVGKDIAVTKPDRISKTKAIARVDSPAVQRAVRSTESPERERALARFDSAATNSMLAEWRTKRDNLLAMQRALATTESKDAIIDIRKMAAPTALQKTEPRAPQLSRTEIEKQLVESWYNLARLTNDPDERTSSVAQIKQIAENTKSSNQALASRYLKQLTAR